MKNKFFMMFAVAMLLSCFAYAAEFPKPHGFVNDFAGVMSPAAKQKLENRVIAYEKATSYEIAVATIPDLAGQPIADYAIHLFSAWGIGKKKLDNGVLLLVAPNESKGATKAWIVTGRGVEENVTDLKSGRIVTETMRPLWKEGKREEAIAAGVERIISVLGNIPFEKRVEEKKRAAEIAVASKKREAELTSSILTGFLIFALIASCTGLIIYFFRNRARRQKELRIELERMRDLASYNYEKVSDAVDEFQIKSLAWQKAFDGSSMFLLKRPCNEMKKAVESFRENMKLTIGLLLEKGKASALDHESLTVLCSNLKKHCHDAMRNTQDIDEYIAILHQSVKASTRVPDLFKEINELLADTEKKVGRNDISDETRGRLQVLKEVIQKEALNETLVAGKKSDEVDWIAVNEKLAHVRDQICKINCDSDVEVEYAKKAREKGPQLLKEVGCLIPIAEGKVSKHGAKVSGLKNRLDKMRNAYHQTCLISQSDSINWIMLYPLLLLIQKESEGISGDVFKFEEQQRESIRQVSQSRSSSRASSGRTSSGRSSNIRSDDSDTYHSSSWGGSSDWGGSSSSISSSSDSGSFGGGDTGGGGGGGGLD